MPKVFGCTQQKKLKHSNKISELSHAITSDTLLYGPVTQVCPTAGQRRLQLGWHNHSCSHRRREVAVRTACWGAVVAGTRVTLRQRLRGTTPCGALLCSHHTNAVRSRIKAASSKGGCILSFRLLSLSELEAPVVQWFSAVCYFSPPQTKIKLNLLGTSVTASSQQESALFPAKGLSTAEQLPFEMLPLLRDWQRDRTDHQVSHPPLQRSRSFGAPNSILGKEAIFPAIK